MDALTMQASVGELTPLLLHNRIEKIYQHGGHELYFKLKDALLLICIHPTNFRIQNTFLRPEHPATPPMFCMLLRKHLTGGRIVGLSMQGKERVVKLTVEGLDEIFQKTTFTLICELMGKHSNVMLVDQGGTILESIKRVPLSVSSVRQVLPGMSYQPPPEHQWQGDPDLAGMSRFLRTQVEQGRVTLQQVGEALEHPRPCIVEGKHPSILPIPGRDNRRYDTLGAMLDDYAHRQTGGLDNTQLIKQLRTLIGRSENKIKIHERELEADIEQDQIYGTLLTSNLSALKRGQTSIELLNFYSNEPVVISLEQRLSPGENAQRYFKKYAKAKAAKTHAREQMEKARGEIDFLEEAVLFLQQASQEQEVAEIRESLYQSGLIRRKREKGKHQPLGPMVYHAHTGAEIWVGRNGQQNDRLTMKKASKNDLWFHAKNLPGSHVILFGGGQDEASILLAAMLAAYYSKGKDGENIPVDYTPVRFVKKPSRSLPGRVIYTDQRTVYVTPDWNKIQEFCKK